MKKPRGALECLMVVFIGLAIVPARADTASLLAGPNTTIGRFFTVRSEDCKAIYFIPLAYTIDASRSSILSETSNGHRTIDMQILLMPELQPSAEETKTILAWAASVDSACATQPTQLTPYPSALQNPVQTGDFSKYFSSLQIYGRSDSSLALHLVIDPAQIQIESVLATLKLFGFEKIVSLQSLQILADASIKADYSAAADFYVKHYVLSSCTYTHESSSILGIPTGDSSSKTCNFTYDDIQLLQNLGVHDGVDLESHNYADIPDDRVADLEQHLMSGLAMSLFVADKQYDEGDITTVWLGKLRRQVSQTYSDYLSIEAVKETPYYINLTTPPLSDFAEAELRRIYEAN